MNAGRRKLGLVLVALAFVSGGCVVVRFLGLEAAPARPFQHKRHVQGEQMDCNACHRGAETGEHAGMPTSLKACMVCHEGIDEQRAEGKKLANLVGDGKSWTSVTALPGEVKFSHQVHVAKGMTCAECHAGMESAEEIPDSVRVTKDACMSCHEERRASNNCATCHEKIRKENPPPSHEQNWKLSHGGMMRWGAGLQAANQCSLCHTESSCVTCHQAEPPQNHTNFWRRQGHSVEAGIDRNRCATCHRGDFCDRCHQETEPRSHTASWGSPRDMHCVQCHIPLSTESCVMCHEGTPSHALAAAKPAWHNSGMNCRQCHGAGLGQALPHPDKGDNCNTCHQ